MLPVLPMFVTSISHQLPVLLAALDNINGLATPLTFVILGASFFALAGVLRRVKEPATDTTQVSAGADVQTVHRVHVAGSHPRKMTPEPVKVSE